MSKQETQLTSVRVPTITYEDFQVKSIRTKVKFQQLVERSLHLYITNKEFQKMIDNHLETFYTGSGQE